MMHLRIVKPGGFRSIIYEDTYCNRSVVNDKYGEGDEFGRQAQSI